MRSMQQQLENLGTISAFACRHRETKKNLCRGGRSQDLPDTDFNSLHVSSNLLIIIRRINFINTISGIYHSVSVTVSCAGRKKKFPTCTLNSHQQRMTYTRCCTDTIDSPDDEHEVARNMQRTEVNTQKRIMRQVGHLPRIITRCTANKI